MSNIKVEICRCFYGGYDNCTNCSSNGVNIYYTDEEQINNIVNLTPIEEEIILYKKAFKYIKDNRYKILINKTSIINAHKIFNKKIKKRQNTSNHLASPIIKDLLQTYEDEVHKLLYYLDDTLNNNNKSIELGKLRQASITLYFDITPDQSIVCIWNANSYESLVFKIKYNNVLTKIRISLSDLYSICLNNYYRQFLIEHVDLEVFHLANKGSENIEVINSFIFDSQKNVYTYTFKNKAYKSIMITYNNYNNNSQEIYFIKMDILLHNIIEYL